MTEAAITSLAEDIGVNGSIAAPPLLFLFSGNKVGAASNGGETQKDPRRYPRYGMICS